jgi:hypothetical protein
MLNPPLALADIDCCFCQFLANDVLPEAVLASL